MLGCLSSYKDAWRKMSTCKNRIKEIETSGNGTHRNIQDTWILLFPWHTNRKLRDFNWCYLLTFLVSQLLPPGLSLAPLKATVLLEGSEEALSKSPCPNASETAAQAAENSQTARSSSSVPWASIEAVSKQDLESGGHLPTQDISRV